MGGVADWSMSMPLLGTLDDFTVFRFGDTVYYVAERKVSDMTTGQVPCMEPKASTIVLLSEECEVKVLGTPNRLAHLYATERLEKLTKYVTMLPTTPGLRGTRDAEGGDDTLA